MYGLISVSILEGLGGIFLLLVWEILCFSLDLHSVDMQNFPTQVEYIYTVLVYYNLLRMWPLFPQTPNNIHPFKRFMKATRSCEPLVLYHTSIFKKKSVEGSAIYFDLLSQSALIGPKSLRICMQAICPLDTILTKLRKHISPFLMV